MAEIVNLRTAKKQAARKAAKARGDENAARHGRSNSQKKREAALSAIQAARLDAHRRDPE